MNYTDPVFDAARQWINSKREKDFSWDTIFLAGKKDETKLLTFLESRAEEDDWPQLTIDDWKLLVTKQKEAEEETIRIDKENGAATIHDDGQANDVFVPILKESSWQCYKRSLENNGFKQETVGEIERATLRVLKRLSQDTTSSKPVKGMVIGNVQSGKTANMAALMAMAADWGWNMFIVLSGTIENLRKQTQSRLFNDLNQPDCQLRWFSLEHLQKRMYIGANAHDLHFEDGAKERFLTVCLKNSGRLRKLIEWLQADPKTQKQLKILVIDDEADQAGINTADVTTHERKTINKLLCNLVNGKCANGSDSEARYKAMNYIGYTATPYANILNEATEESLYPRNFISTLKVSKEYFGPQQIFGVDSGEYEGIDIIRNISDEDKHIISDIHKDETSDIPVSMIHSICWFLCGVSCMRLWEYKKPISMLVHTSQNTSHHEHIANAIYTWIVNTPDEKILSTCREVWDKDTRQFTKADLREQYPDYGLPDEAIRDYPAFEDIEPGIKLILSDERISSIPLDAENQTPVYHKGIHLCVDNCKNNGIDNDMIVRLVYPEKGNMPSPAPAFIVVGGATLSRGLTLEGLISTYFLRSVHQSDTLMQMGRWFGYRKGYELIPRLWICKDTQKQFEFLSSLDQDLRDEIHRMDTFGISPAQYGPQVKNSPKLSFIRIVAKNKMQMAQPSTLDFGGSSTQTYLFDNDEHILSENLKETRIFLQSLGAPAPHKPINQHAEHSIVWRNIPFACIKEYLQKYHFQNRMGAFCDIDPLVEWVEHITEEGVLTNWNIVLVGSAPNAKHTSSWAVDENKNDLRIYKVNRSRLVKDTDPSIINMGALRAPKDLLADIDLDGVDESLRSEIKNFSSKYAMELREKVGLKDTPQMLIYVVDKDSKGPKDAKKRTDLAALEDIVGLCINIPGNYDRTNNVATVSIPVRFDVDSFNYTDDLNETTID